MCLCYFAFCHQQPVISGINPSGVPLGPTTYPNQTQYPPVATQHPPLELYLPPGQHPTPTAPPQAQHSQYPAVGLVSSQPSGQEPHAASYSVPLAWVDTNKTEYV